MAEERSLSEILRTESGSNKATFTTRNNEEISYNEYLNRVVKNATKTQWGNLWRMIKCALKN